MFRVDDEVMSTGDNWMMEGSLGTIIRVKHQGSIYVRWHTPKSGKHTPGTSLYHKGDDLIHAQSKELDPNLAYRIKRRFDHEE